LEKNIPLLNSIRSICVFCGSSAGSQDTYSRKAHDLGKLLAAEGITLVYGGSNVGIMRVIADTVLASGGHVTGIMPHSLIEREVAHPGNTEFHVVDTMAERKHRMGELSDAFVAMPGGIGTLDELFEVMSWNQLEIMNKPVALLNISHYYDSLIRFLEHAVEQRFIKPEHLENLIIASDEHELLDKLRKYSPKKVDGGKWIRELRENSYL